MIGTNTATLRLKGSGDHLRLRVGNSADPLVNVRECCRASVAVEKAMGEAIRDALAAGHSWAEVGQALGVEANNSARVAGQYNVSQSWMRGEVLGNRRRGGEVKRALMSLTGLYLLFAVIGRFRGHGSRRVQLRR